MAAFDMDDPLSIVSPGGVGFDINCGVRLLRTNLTEKDVRPVQVRQSLLNRLIVKIVMNVLLILIGTTCTKSLRSHSSGCRLKGDNPNEC